MGLFFFLMWVPGLKLRSPYLQNKDFPNNCLRWLPSDYCLTCHPYVFLDSVCHQCDFPFLNGWTRLLELDTSTCQVSGWTGEWV